MVQYASDLGCWKRATVLKSEEGCFLPGLQVHDRAMELQITQGGAGVVRVRALEREEHDFVSMFVSELVALGAGRKQDGAISRGLR